MGPFINSPTRIISGLVQRFGRLNFVSDTTGALVFMAVVPDESSDSYPDEVPSDR